MDSLGLAAARQIAEQAMDDASRLAVRISVAVADEAGALLAFARMDGATRLSARTAVAKTQTVILTGKATLDLGREWREELGAEPELFHGMIARPDVVPFGGGVPLHINGRLAGAVAVSGATSVQDHEIAARGGGGDQPSGTRTRDTVIGTCRPRSGCGPAPHPMGAARSRAGSTGFPYPPEPAPGMPHRSHNSQPTLCPLYSLTCATEIPLSGSIRA